MPIGVMVTLRGQRMYEFFDRLVNAALPRIRDFRGLPTKAFDGRGNYSLGVREQLIFPEIDYDKVDRIRGMQINICHQRAKRRRRQAAARAPGHAVREGECSTVAKISMIVKGNRTQVQGRSIATAAGCADGREATSATSRCAASASASWRSRVRSRASRSRAGRRLST